VKLTFRQGIARYQTDVSGTPIFLQKAFGGVGFIDLIVAPDPTILIFAHYDANYIVEEPRTVKNAWGPISGPQTIYLFWDISLQTAVLTRGTTLFPPMYSGSPPLSPAIDQHWFDTNDTVMRIWNGSKWIEKIRVFAGFLSSGSIIKPFTSGTSQAGIQGDFEGGNIVLDAYNKPLRQSDGSFVTSATSLLIINNATRKVKFEAEVMSGMAMESIPKYRLVQMRQGARIALARSTDFMSRIAGMVPEDLYTSEVGFLVTEGLVRNPSWSFPPSSVNRPIFSGELGEITVVPPIVGVCQIAGFVYDTDSVYMNIQSPIILDDISVYAPPPPPTPGAPIADFTSSVTTGNAPLTVLFTSIALGSPSGYEWDFTNDGTPDAYGPITTFTFSTPGVYNVRHRVTNAFGFDDEIKTSFITVLQPPASGAFTNLDITLGGPSQALRNGIFQISISISNAGLLTATSVIRKLSIPKFKGEVIQITNLPAGTTTIQNYELTVITFPPVPTLNSGLTYGPIFFTVKAPSKGGDLKINASVESPEVDSTIGDNTTSLTIQIKP